MEDGPTASAHGRDQARADKAHAWVLGGLLAFWAGRAPQPRGGFRDRLQIVGPLSDDDVGHAAILAQHICIASTASRLGWRPDDAPLLIRHGVETLLGQCRRPDRLFGRLYRPGVGMLDPQPDLWVNAWCLISLGLAAQATNDSALLAEADATASRLERTHAHDLGGYAEAPGTRGLRRQGPQRLLLDAFVTLFQASGTASYRAQAAALQKTCVSRFIDARKGYVRAMLDDGLKPSAPLRAPLTQPACAFQWVSLLHRFAEAFGRELDPCVEPLYSTAVAAADAEGFIPATALTTGAPVDDMLVLRDQLAALEAHLHRASAGDPTAADRARLMFDSVFQAFLPSSLPGSWIERRPGSERGAGASLSAASALSLVSVMAQAAQHPAMAASHPAFSPVLAASQPLLAPTTIAAGPAL